MERVHDNNSLDNLRNVNVSKQINNSIKSLIEWSGKSNFTIIFDSDIDGNGKGVLIKKVFNKKNLYFITFDDADNVFGGYVNEVINVKDNYVHDEKAFLFSLI